MLAAAVEGAGAPQGVFALVEGQATGRALIADRGSPRCLHRSLRGGRALFDLASARETPIPFYGELGSVNPAFVTAAAARPRGGDRHRLRGLDDARRRAVLHQARAALRPGGLRDPRTRRRAPRRRRRRTDAQRADPGGYGQALSALAAHEVVEVLAGTVDPDADPAPTLLRTSAAEVLADPRPLTAEVFGPAALVVEYADDEELLAVARVLDGQLTATVQGEPDDQVVPALLDVLSERAGRVLWGGWPTGVPSRTPSSTGARTRRPPRSPGRCRHRHDGALPPPGRLPGPAGGAPPGAAADRNPWQVPQRIDGVQHP